MNRIEEKIKRLELCLSSYFTSVYNKNVELLKENTELKKEKVKLQKEIEQLKNQSKK